MAKYEIEIWDKSGKPLANIRHICSQLVWRKALNDAESVSFVIDLGRYEEILESIGMAGDPFGLLEVGSHDIRIKRNGQYIIGCNVIKLSYATADPSITVTVSCAGYLNYYKNRYITESFNDIYQEEILYGVLDYCNAQQGGDYGITRGEVYGGEKTLRTRNYLRKEVKSLFQQMSSVIGGPDFDFTPDKKLNIYEAKGVYRPSVRLKYPGNIQMFSFNRSIEKVANYVYAVGSGNGADAVYATAENSDSESQFYRREKIATYNSVTLEGTLQDHADAILHYTKDPIELPSVTVGDGTLDLNQVDVGDTIKLSLTGNLSLGHIDGDYRIQILDVTVDDNDSETVAITFDGLDADEIIQLQQPEGSNES